MATGPAAGRSVAQWLGDAPQAPASGPAAGKSVDDWLGTTPQGQSKSIPQPKGFFGTLAKDPFQEFAQHNLVLNLYRAAKNGNLEKFLKDPKLVHSTLHDLPHEMKAGLESFVKQAVQDPGGAAAQLINGIVADPEMLFLGGIEGGAVRRTLLGAATGGAIGAGSEAGAELAKHPELNVGQVVQSATGGAVTGGAFAGVLGHGGKEPEPRATTPEPTPVVSPELSKSLQAKSAEVYAKTPEEHIHAGLQIGPQPEPVALKPREWTVPKSQRGSVQPEVFKEGIQKIAGQKQRGISDELRDVPYTSKVLDNLPQNKAVLSVDQIKQQLNRSDVTGPEKDAFNAIIQMYGKDGKVPAADLVKGFRLATEQYHLTPEETSEYSDYGLHQIDRGNLAAEHDWVPEGEDRPLQDRESQATTTKYKLPFQIPQSNHFSNDPNLFGWTRSFHENGVRHIVELQSDLAQKGQTELSPEAREHLGRQLESDRERLARFESKLQDMRHQYGANDPDVHEQQLSIQILKLRIAEQERKLAPPVAKEQLASTFKHWERKLVQQELARGHGAPVRFATPDTVAKVEGWEPSSERLPAELYQKIKASTPEEGKRLYQEWERAHKLQSPEHQSIYDRYQRNVVPYLKSLGGKEVTDAHGHTWIEVPTKVGMKARMYGAADVDVLKKLGIAAGGAVAFSYLDPQDKWKSYATGAALGLAGAWLAPRVKEGLAADSRVRIDKYANDFEAASQLAEVRLHQQVGAIRKALPNAEDRAAVTRAIDEGRPAATPEQAKVQAAVKQFFSDVGRLAQEHGVLKELRDNYVTHLWDNPVNRSRFGSALTTTSPFTKARTFTTLAEGKAAGLVPRTEDIADIMEAYGRSMNRAMQGKTFIGTLKGLKAPDGRPLIAKADAAPKGYVPVDLPQLRGSLVHPDIAQSLSMFESGRLHGPLEGVSESMQALKRIKVMGSLFHIKSLAEAGIGSTPVTKWAALPKRIAGFALGRDEMLKQLNEGGMSQDATDLLRHGINISLERETPGVEDIGGSFYQGMTNLQQYLDANLPQAGKVSKAFTELNHKLDTITWGRVHTGLKLMVGSETMHRLERNGVPREKAAEIAANFVNTQFGGLNWRRIAEGARSRWGRDFSMAMLHPKARTVSQILLFAPDWTISTIRQYTQAIRRSGGPLEQAKGLVKPTELADLHRLALLRGAMYYLAVGDAVNYMLSGHHLWQNKNPLRIDLGNGQTMQFSKHLTEPLEWVHAPAKTAAGKLSYMVTEPIDQLTGKEYIGGPPMQESPVVHAAEGLLPFPATSGGPAQAVAGMAGFPIYGHTPEQMREIARERRERKNTPEARAHRRKLREERRNY